MSRTRLRDVSRRRIAGAPLALLALVFTAVGCDAGPTAPSTVIDEAWRYAGEQRSPTYATLDGALSWTRADGSTAAGRVTGRVELSASDGVGGVDRRAGVAVGRRQGEALEFDVQFARGVVRHVGRVRGDTVTGSWIEEGTSGVVASGIFRLERVR